jgi:hypothetical protein
MSDKIEQFWRDSTADDVARVMKGEKVEARFRDEDYEEWRDGEFLGGLRAFRSIPLAWIDLDGVQWAQCQVYEPQQWWLDKPDPGEGWRLLDPFKEKNLEKFDEFFCTATKAWRQSANAMLGKDQQPETWYRRRIEPIEPTPSNCVAYETQVDEIIELPNGKRFKVTKEGFEVL